MLMCRYIALFFITFTFIYTPPYTFFPLPVDVLVYGLFFVLFLRNKDSITQIFKFPGVRNIISILFFIFVFAFIHDLLSPDVSKLFIMNYKSVSTLRFIIEAIFFPFILIKEFKKKNSEKEILVFLFTIALVQSYISNLMVFVPVVKDFIVTAIISFGSLSKLRADSLLNTRVFGIGSEYLFAFPVFQAMMACLYFQYTRKKNVFFVFNFVSLVLSAIVCSRTSFFVIVAYFIYITYLRILLDFKKKTLHFSFLFFITLILTSGYFAFQYILQLDDIVAFVNFAKAFNGEYDGGYDKLFDTFLFFPDDLLTWLIGDGSYVFFAAKNSDIGYIGQLFYGGLFYMFLIFSIFRILYSHSKLIPGNCNVLSFMILMLIGLNYKGSIFVANDFIKGMFLMYYAFLPSTQHIFSSSASKKDLKIKMK